MLVADPFVKDLGISETCALVNNNLCGKLVLPSPKHLKLLEHHFFSDLNLMSCELDNFVFKLLYQVTSH